MPLIENESIVLKSHDLAEADRIIVAITRDHGVIRGVAKGIKRLNSKFGSTLEPFNIIRLTYFQREDRELVSIQNADLLRSNFIVASRPEVLSAYSYFGDLMLAFSLPGDPNQVLFRMLKACLETEMPAGSDNLLLRFYFESWLLRLAGVLPDWRRCHTCGREFFDDERPAFDSAQHLVCENCHAGRLTGPISLGWLTAIRSVRKETPEDFIKLDQNFSAIAELTEAHQKIIDRSLDQPIRTRFETAAMPNG